MGILKRKKSSMNELPKAIDLDEDSRGVPGRGLLELQVHTTPPIPRVQYMHGPNFDDVIESVENELAQYRPKAVEPMPEYVEPREGVPPVGALSAEAIVKDFEKTAKGIEAMAAELMDASNRCAEELIALTNKYKELGEQINQVVQHVKDTAESYRDEAKTVFVRIEDTTMRMKEVRELSDTMRQRLAESAGTGAN
jgi:hypothetical protein